MRSSMNSRMTGAIPDELGDDKPNRSGKAIALKMTFTAKPEEFLYLLLS